MSGFGGEQIDVVSAPAVVSHHSVEPPVRSG